MLHIAQVLYVCMSNTIHPNWVVLYVHAFMCLRALNYISYIASTSLTIWALRQYIIIQ